MIIKTEGQATQQSVGTVRPVMQLEGIVQELQLITVKIVIMIVILVWLEVVILEDRTITQKYLQHVGIVTALKEHQSLILGLQAKTVWMTVLSVT